MSISTLLDSKNKKQIRSKGRRRAMAGSLLMALATTASLVATSAASPVASRKTPVYPPVSHAGQPLGKAAWLQVGKASWYGGQFNGRKTATGERFDMHALTCAHRTLPLGTWVRVTNLVNHKFAFLRVNDRGPMAHAFIVDLSYGAAQKLGIAGLGKVKIEALSPSTPELTAQMAQLHEPTKLVRMDAAHPVHALPVAAIKSR